MRLRRTLTLLVILLPTPVTLSGCGAADNANNANASINTNANVSSRLDDALGKMANANSAFKHPDSMKLGETRPVTFLLSPEQTAKEVEEELRKEAGPGRVETNRVKISDKMQARLTGDGFQIEPKSDETQLVSRLEETKWVWEVRPERAGTQYLYLSLSALVDLGDGAGERPVRIRPYPKSYAVVVPEPRRVWPWLLPALLAPAGGVAAWLWLRGGKRRRAAARWFSPGAGESRIFLSYRREDTAGHAGRLRDALVERFGPGRVFMDLESIRGGDDFVETLEKAVASCAVVVVLIGRQWLSAPGKDGQRRLDDPHDFVRLEVEAALKRGVRVIPALVQGAVMPGEDVLPAPLAKLARRNAVEISDLRWDYDVGRLVEVIEETLESEPAKREEPSALPG